MNEVEKYLSAKGIQYSEKNGELITKCVFPANCDKDSRGSEAHLYINAKTGQYECKKCGESGNLFTLKKYFGDLREENKIPKRNIRTLTPKLVETYHEALTPEIMSYLRSRGLSEEVIKACRLGYGSFYGSWWITIPIKDINGNYSFFKLRQDPKYGNEKMTWPSGGEAQVYDWDSLLMAKDKLVVCEGEMDSLLLKSMDIASITNTHGANTVKDIWMEHFKIDIEYYICYDNDQAGRSGALKMANALVNQGCNKVYVVDLPEEVGDKGDIGDYFIKHGLPLEDLFTKYAKPYPEKIDVSQFKEITIQDVCQILESTIKKDDGNKAITFLAMLSTYTDESQLNLFFNAPSSTGKSHIPLSVIKLFPKEDTIILAYCSPSAFFHEQGQYDKERNLVIVDLSRKILCFTDMPDPSLLQKLRPLLAHDQKESVFKITDKNQKGGNRTKTGVILGFPSVYFCSAGLKVDEQENTRFIMLSPSIEHEKIVQGIKQVITRESNQSEFDIAVENDPERKSLMERIRAIKQEAISDVKIENPQLIEDIFLNDKKGVKPRQQRDIKKIMFLIKAFALLNIWFRKREDTYVWATEKDVRDAFELWEEITYGQDYGLAPYIFEIYTKVILPLWNEPSKDFGELSGLEDKKKHITRKEILHKHFQVYGRPLSLIYLRQHILPQLEQAGLITQERSTDDKREMVVIPQESELDLKEI